MVWRVLGSSKMAFALSDTPPILLGLSLSILPYWWPSFSLFPSASSCMSQRPVEVHLGASKTGFSDTDIVVVVAS